jgi:hypothetical protein
MSTLDPTQIAVALRKTPVVLKRVKETFTYNPDTYDEVIEKMFRRKWLDEETLPPRAKEIWSALFQPVIGNCPAFEDLELIMSVAVRTKSDTLRTKSIAAMKLHLTDCSGTNDELKGKVQETLNNLTGVAA